MRRKYLCWFVLSFLVACNQQATRQSPGSIGIELPETPVTEIVLTGPLAQRDAEISGLAWYGDTLILLPQYPDFNGDSNLYALQKPDIEAYLAANSPAPLKPQPVPFIDAGIAAQIDGFQGFEAIAFAGDHVYLTVEAERNEGMYGYLVKGQIAPDLKDVMMESAIIGEILPQARHDNRTDETLLIYSDTLITVYEVNGRTINEKPVAHRFDFDLNTLESLPFPNIEYRVTDATNVDEKGHFWIINLNDPRDKELQTNNDALADRFGRGATHLTYKQVERLVEMQITEAGIDFTDTPPILLELLSDVTRKWEGIARFKKGFLLATDKYPETLLVYVGK